MYALDNSVQFSVVGTIFTILNHNLKEVFKDKTNIILLKIKEIMWRFHNLTQFNCAFMDVISFQSIFLTDNFIINVKVFIILVIIIILQSIEINLYSNVLFWIFPKTFSTNLYLYFSTLGVSCYLILLPQIIIYWGGCYFIIQCLKLLCVCCYFIHQLPQIIGGQLLFLQPGLFVSFQLPACITGVSTRKILVATNKFRHVGLATT